MVIESGGGKTRPQTAYEKFLAAERESMRLYQESQTQAPGKTLKDVLPWATQVSPYETFYTRAINEYLNWTYQNDPERFLEYFGYQTPQLPGVGEWMPSGAGGAAGGGGAAVPPTPRFTMRDILEHLQFPQMHQYSPYMRDYGRYLEELITQNPQFAIPVPEMEEGKLLPTPEDLESLEYFETAEKFAGAWNEFLTTLLNIPFFQQQYHLGLRYGPETGWYRSGQVPMLAHPEYL